MDGRELTAALAAAPAQGTASDTRRSEFRDPQPPNPLFRDLQWRLLTGVKLKEEMLLPGDNSAFDYFQIDHPPGKAYLSRSMGEPTFSAGPLRLSAGPADLRGLRQPDGRHEHPRSSGRAQVLRRRDGSICARLERRFPGKRATRRVSRCLVMVRPSMSIARPPRTNAMLPSLAFVGSATTSWAKVAAETGDSLRDLRLRLIAISLAVFAATGIGGFWLVPPGSVAVAAPVPTPSAACPRRIFACRWTNGPCRWNCGPLSNI